MSLLTAWTVTGCARIYLEKDQHGQRDVSLALSVTVTTENGSVTKMTDAVTQYNGVFRGIEKVFIVPFQTLGEPVEAGQDRWGEQNVVLGTTAIGQLIDDNKSKFFNTAIIPLGMDHVLVYGKAPDGGENASKNSKHTFGVLKAHGLEDPYSADDISFFLEPILRTGTTNELQVIENKADELLESLNNVMLLMGSSQYPSIVSISDAVKRENHILSCSYSTLNQLRNEIQTLLMRTSGDISFYESRGVIISALNDFSNLLNSVDGTFPASYGIPEGALGFFWNGNEFVRLINGVNIALVNPASYCYPPCLWYFANSTIRTSTDQSIKSYYVPGKTWDEILSEYDDGDIVEDLTESVAVVDQLQYAVGMLELQLGAIGPEASVAEGCTLTGIILGDQRDMDFSFAPITGRSRFIYDTAPGGMLIGESGPVLRTLVLPTMEGENGRVRFALEFKNTKGVTIHGQQEDILPWCKFYLAGELDPSTATGGSSSLNRVFSSHYITSVTVNIMSLRGAYNTVPDLRDPQLEIGMVAEMKWSSFTPQSISLEF